MIKTHRFRLYPTKSQEEILNTTLNVCRMAYNTLLGEFNNWDSISQYELQSLIPNLKICDNLYASIYSKLLQHENSKIFRSLKALAELKKKGYKVGQLRFKGKNWFKSFTYNQSGFRLICLGKRCDTLRLSKIGDLKIRCHRKIQGNIKQVAIKRESSGKWYASLIEELPNNIKKLDISSITEDKVVGIDLGVKDVVYDSDNRNIPNPKHLQFQVIKLAKIQRIFSRKSKGSNNKEKYRILLARQHEYVANIRDDFIHKLSYNYVENYDVIGFEDMDISGLVKDNNLAKEILDASWGKLRRYTFYKAESAGKMCVFVETKGTTYTCHNCKEYAPKKLCDRIHKCPTCGIKIPRDYNSSMEIKYRTLKEIGMGRAESMPVEMEALSFRGQLPSENQEAMPFRAW